MSEYGYFRSLHLKREVCGVRFGDGNIQIDSMILFKQGYLNCYWYSKGSPSRFNVVDVKSSSSLLIQAIQIEKRKFKHRSERPSETFGIPVAADAVFLIDEEHKW